MIQCVSQLDAHSALRSALEWMQATPESEGPFVVVDDLVTGRFVQFCGGAGTPILLDLVVGDNLPNDGAIRAMELLGDTVDNPVGKSFQETGTDPSEMATLGCQVLRECLMYQPTAPLTITRECTFSPD
jgi:hypothetical protein